MTVSPLTPETAEVAEVMPVADAQRLDKRIRLIVNNIDDNFGRLGDLIREAQVGQIHVALGFDSWTAYVADAVRLKPESIEQRREMVALMSGEGMSQRAIAPVVGVSQKTVDRDLEHVSHDDSPEPGAQVMGLNGKTSERKPKAKGTPKRPPITDEWDDAVRKLTKAINRVVDITCEGARFTRNRDKLTPSDLQQAIKTLQAVVDKLGTDDVSAAQ